MTLDEFSEAMSRHDALSQSGEYRFPHGFSVYSLISNLYSNDEIELPDNLDKAWWDSIEWNPGYSVKMAQIYFDEGLITADELLVMKKADPTAAPKLTWDEILLERKNYLFGDKRSTLLRDISFEVRQRITLNYGAVDTIDETFMRLRGDGTAAQNIERDRLRAKYQVHKAWINDSARTINELELFAVSSDVNWIA